MRNRFIDEYQVLLLDMGNTFMFGGDRYGEAEDYHATYRELGGTVLSRNEVQTHIAEVFDRMLTAARDPSRVNDFGDVRRFLAESKRVVALPASEVNLLVDVFSQHEVGSIPQTHAEAIHQLRASHPIGIVSNVWSPSSVFESALDRVGIRDLFAVRVWSSDCLSIKPSPRLFQKALDAFRVDAARTLYVGDNPRRDIVGAKAMGMGVVWIENPTRPLTPEIPEPDLIISDLTQLAKATSNERTAEQPDRTRLR